MHTRAGVFLPFLKGAVRDYLKENVGFRFEEPMDSCIRRIALVGFVWTYETRASCLNLRSAVMCVGLLACLQLCVTEAPVQMDVTSPVLRPALNVVAWIWHC